MGNEAQSVRRMWSRAGASGTGTAISRSRRPGRRRAGSIARGRFVVQSTTRRSFSPPFTPSSSVSRRATVRALPEVRSTAPSRRGHNPSTSSMRRTQPRPDCRATACASTKVSRRRCSASPMYASLQSLVLRCTRGTLQRCAASLATEDLPVPGGPDKRTPPGGEIRTVVRIWSASTHRCKIKTHRECSKSSRPPSGVTLTAESTGSSACGTSGTN
mmetsp:Transcript_4319/g.10655  ORF Transcript_4319/g.10655 Transcript_4319/m.10655 type:complete len:216 (+) Transcript_4319:1225-1872(+)